MISMSQIVLFVALVPSLVVAEAYYEDRLEIRRALPLAGVAVCSVIVARLFGGFFTSAPDLPSLPFKLHAGFSDTISETVRWNAKSFGLLLPLGVIGLAVMRRARLLFFLLIAGSILVLNGVRYGLSADIMKFGALAAIALSVAGSAAIARLLPAEPRRSPAEPRRSPARVAIAALVLAGACVWGVLFPLVFALDLAEIPGPLRTKPDVLGADDVRAISFLRRRVKPGEMVYRGDLVSHGYAQWGGLPQPAITWSTKAFGFPPERVAARERLMATKPADVAAWRRERFRWLVIDDGKDDAAVRRNVEAWASRGQARLVATFGALRVFELLW
jgi:hypothetical protein